MTGASRVVYGRRYFERNSFNVRIVAFPPELCVEMAANLTGTEAGGEPTAVAEDALCEVVNVVCGHLVTALAGEDAEVIPGIAKVTHMETEGWKPLLADPETSAFQAGGEVMLVRLSVEKRRG